jgi:hypothetical protein
VRAAGVAEIVVDDYGPVGIRLSTEKNGLEIGKQAFQAFGMAFLLEKDTSGNVDGKDSNSSPERHERHDENHRERQNRGDRDGNNGGNGGGHPVAYDGSSSESDEEQEKRGGVHKAVLKNLFERRNNKREEKAAAQHTSEETEQLQDRALQTLESANQPEVRIPTDLSAVRAAYPALDQQLIQIEEKLRAQGQADLFQIIEEVSQHKRMVGFADWVAQSAGREAEQMLDVVMELAEARRLLQEHLADPSVIVRFGQDAHIAGRSFDITVECQFPNGESQILRQIEVYTPSTGINRGHEPISAIAHAAEKIPLGVRDGTESLPPGTLEATIAVPWPPASVRLGGDAQKVYDTHGGYRGCSITDPTVPRGKNGNLLQDTVDELNRKGYYENPVECVTRLTVIDLTGQALFELTNTTPNMCPAQWTWKDLQGQ